MGNPENERVVIKPDEVRGALRTNDPKIITEMAKTLINGNFKKFEKDDYSLIYAVIGWLDCYEVRAEEELESLSTNEEFDELGAKIEEAKIARVDLANDTNDLSVFDVARSSSVEACGGIAKKTRKSVDTWTGTKGRAAA